MTNEVLEIENKNEFLSEFKRKSITEWLRSGQIANGVDNGKDSKYCGLS